MNEFTWSLLCGDDSMSGKEANIAHAIAELRGALDDLVATADDPEAEGVIAGPDVGTLPFWIRWGLLSPADSDDPARDGRRARSCIDELTEGLRDELHRAVDKHAMAADHPAR